MDDFTNTGGGVGGGGGVDDCTNTGGGAGGGGGVDDCTNTGDHLFEEPTVFNAERCILHKTCHK